MDKISNDVRVYTDVQGLEQLRGEYKTNPDMVKKEMAHQFESLLIQMVLRSMRDANNAFSSDLFSNDAMSTYQDMFDKQLSLGLSARGMGLSAAIEQNIDQQMGMVPKPAKLEASNELPKTETNYYHAQHANTQPILSNKETAPMDQTVSAALAPEIKKENKTTFGSPQEFVQTLWSSAKHAASIIGASPAVLLAQAALETDWGKKIIQHGFGDSSHNLFNIKSDPNWQKATTTASTLEHKDGVLVKEKANFRSYDSFKESFMDYANLIKNNARYQKALENAHEPAAYSQALQDAGYATDKQYANKIMGIMKSPQFQSLLAEVK